MTTSSPIKKYSKYIERFMDDTGLKPGSKKRYTTSTKKVVEIDMAMDTTNPLDCHDKATLIINVYILGNLIEKYEMDINIYDWKDKINES